MPQRPTPHGVAKLMISIRLKQANGKFKETEYLVRKLPCDPSIGRIAWRMTKLHRKTKRKGGEVLVIKKEIESNLFSESYEVIDRVDGGPHCDCKDFAYCREHTGQGCKHVRCLQACGLMGQDVAVIA